MKHLYLLLLIFASGIFADCDCQGSIEVLDRGFIADADISIDNGFSADINTSDNSEEYCTEASEKICYTGPDGTSNRGRCKPGKMFCTDNRWGECLGEVLPEKNDLCGNGVDDNCNGSIDEGCGCIIGSERECYSGPIETKGVGICRTGRQRCKDDGNGNGVWDLCAGEVNPSSEVCGDGLDNNCNGKVDEGCTCLAGSEQDCFAGPDNAVFNETSICKKGKQVCINNELWSECEGEVLPQMEICGNGKDDDCDGVVDNGCICKPEEEVDCYDGPAGTDGKGVCHKGKAICKDGREIGECKGEQLPEVEVCDGLDNDCNGKTDDGINCLPEDHECKEGDVCLNGTECIPFPNGKNYCTKPCTPDKNECKADERCTPLTNGKWYCVDKPDTPRYGCGWMWSYLIEKSQKIQCGPYGAHLDMGGGCPSCNMQCSELLDLCKKVENNRYDCGNQRGWWFAGEIVDDSGNIIAEIHFETLSFGINNARVIDYCVLAWGFHRADPYVNSLSNLIFEAGKNTSFSYKSVSINSDLFDNFAKIDPINFNNVPSVDIVWDISAESLKNTKMPYDYYGLNSGGSCENGAPSLKAGSVTYEGLVEYVQTVELPSTGIGETGEYNIALAHYVPYYYSLGYKAIALTAGLYCHSIDGNVYPFTTFVGMYNPKDVR